MAQIGIGKSYGPVLTPAEEEERKKGIAANNASFYEQKQKQADLGAFLAKPSAAPAAAAVAVKPAPAAAPKPAVTPAMAPDAATTPVPTAAMAPPPAAPMQTAKPVSLLEEQRQGLQNKIADANRQYQAGDAVRRELSTGREAAMDAVAKAQTGSVDDAQKRLLAARAFNQANRPAVQAGQDAAEAVSRAVGEQTAFNQRLKSAKALARSEAGITDKSTPAQKQAFEQAFAAKIEGEPIRAAVTRSEIDLPEKQIAASAAARREAIAADDRKLDKEIGASERAQSMAIEAQAKSQALMNQSQKELSELSGKNAVALLQAKGMDERKSQELVQQFQLKLHDRQFEALVNQAKDITAKEESREIAKQAAIAELVEMITEQDKNFWQFDRDDLQKNILAHEIWNSQNPPLIVENTPQRNK